MRIKWPNLPKKQYSQAIAILVLLVLALFGVTLSKADQNRITSFIDQQIQKTPLAAGTYRVLSVDDGDTIVVDMNGRKETIRFIGVDTPEIHDPRKVVQCFGRAATEFTKDLIGDNPVRLEADALNTNRDRYNRLLRYVYLPDGTLVNAKIIQEGYGFAYTSFPMGRSDEFKQYEKEARENNRGLWSQCEPQANQYGGFDSNPE